MQAFSCNSIRRRLSLLFVLSWSVFALLTTSFHVHAGAPARPGQPYAEPICNTDPNIIFCEDFNYPQNFYCAGSVGSNNHRWINPGFAEEMTSWVYGCTGRQINPLGNYPAQPNGSPAGGYVWTANWDPTKGPQANGGSPGKLRQSGSNYVNGSAPAKELYFRFQYYVTPDYKWPGDPKTDKYAYGAYPCFDNKILYLFPPEGLDNPTNAAYDAGLFTACGIWDNINNARFSDALAVRYGDAGDNYKFFPMNVAANFNPQHMEYAPYQSLTLRNPDDKPIFGTIFRFNTNRWYTVELRYKLGTSAGAKNGTVEVWIDGTKIYSANDLATCGSGLGDCSGIGAIWLGAYHNGSDVTSWDGQQVIDNLIISRSYIGPPAGGSPPPPKAPAAPSNLSIAP